MSRAVAPKTVLVALIAAGLAGCIQGPGSTGGPLGDGPDDVARSAMSVIEGIPVEHEHGNASEHDASYRMDPQGHAPLLEDGTMPSYLGEMDHHGSTVVQAVVGAGSTPGFFLLDVSDPEEPETLGRGLAPDSYVVDVKFGSSGDVVYAATQEIGTNRAHQPRGDGVEQAARNGIMIFDVSDPTDPTFRDFVPVEPLGCHMLSTMEIDGSEHVSCVGASIVLFRAVEGGGHRSLAPVSRVATTDAGAYQSLAAKTAGGEIPVPGPLPHDAVLQEDPIEGTPLLVASLWDLGVAVYDVSVPAAPVEIGTWGGQDAANYHGYVHTAQVVALNGSRYVVASPEMLIDAEPAIWFLEADEWQMTLDQEWVGYHSARGLTLTTHQWHVVEQRLYLAYNHNGVWVLDVPTILDRAHGDGSEVVAIHQPGPNGHEVHGGEAPEVSDIWDVNVVEGTIVASGRYTGVHLMRAPDDPRVESYSSTT